MNGLSISGALFGAIIAQCVLAQLGQLKWAQVADRIVFALTIVGGAFIAHGFCKWMGWL